MVIASDYVSELLNSLQGNELQICNAGSYLYPAIAPILVDILLLTNAAAAHNRMSRRIPGEGCVCGRLAALSHLQARASCRQASWVTSGSTAWR